MSPDPPRIYVLAPSHLLGQKVKPRWPPMEENFGRQFQSSSRSCTSVPVLYATLIVSHRIRDVTRSLTWGCNVSLFSSAHVRDPPCWQPDNSSQATRNIMAKNQLGSLKRLYLEKYLDDFRFTLICPRGKVRDQFYRN